MTSTTSRTQSIVTVDAFSNRPFAGNPAAVCLLDAEAQERWMSLVAREMNLSETAFLVPLGPEPSSDGYSLRWFTPTVEVDLCGHATLAAAHVLWEEQRLPSAAQARFLTRSGWLGAQLDSDGWITLDFPAKPIGPEGASPAELAEALGVIPVLTARNGMDCLVVLEREQQVRELAPDLTMLATIDVRGVIVTAEADSRSGPYQFVSRFFAPRAGVPEDPVTGSAHCCLGPFWSARLGQSDLVGYQASARGGYVRVGCRGDRVLLGGQAVTMSRGVLLAPP